MREIEFDGRVYPSIAAASRWLGVPYQKLKGVVEPCPEGSHKPVPVTIRGVVHDNVTAAARALNITPCSVWRAREEGRLDTVGLGHRQPGKG